ncbi:MAG: hypothetical protein ACTSVV_05795 [Promethearchaeota archaeon]
MSQSFHVFGRKLQQEILTFNSLEKALEQINFILMILDNPSKSFINKDRTGLKRSIMLPPHDFHVDPTIQEPLVSVLDEIIVKELF